MNMQPTLHFRWLESTHTIRTRNVLGVDYVTPQTVRTLQQGWAPSGGGLIEWRDVPTVTNPATPESNT